MLCPANGFRCTLQLQGAAAEKKQNDVTVVLQLTSPGQGTWNQQQRVSVRTFLRQAAAEGKPSRVFVTQTEEQNGRTKLIQTTTSIYTNTNLVPAE